MPGQKDDLPEILYYEPWWRKADPGPPWIFEEVGAESRVELAVSQLQYEKEVIEAHRKALEARSKAIDRNIAIIGAAAKKP